MPYDNEYVSDGLPPESQENENDDLDEEYEDKFDNPDIRRENEWAEDDEHDAPWGTEDQHEDL